MVTPQQGITGKVVVVTGASSGLGDATARHLAARGAKLVLAARRADRLQQLVDDIRRDGGDAIAVETDVAQRADVETLVAKAEEAFGPVDVLVNNAGVMLLAPLEQVRVDEWDRMIDVNIRGVLHGIAAVLPGMRERRRGHVINIASIAGHKVFSPIGAVYSMTKFAVRAISEGLRAEAPAGVRTTIVSPGAVASELKEHTTDAGAASGVNAFYEQNQIGADSIARAIAYAIEQPDDVDINEVVVRPTVQDF